jgi:hypothetical protein
MIQLANDPNASRMSWRPKAQADKAAAEAPRRLRAHAWPFLSPHARRPDRPDAPKASSQDSGS